MIILWHNPNVYLALSITWTASARIEHYYFECVAQEKQGILCP